MLVAEELVVRLYRKLGDGPRLSGARQGRASDRMVAMGRAEALLRAGLVSHCPKGHAGVPDGQFRASVPAPQNDRGASSACEGWTLHAGLHDTARLTGTTSSFAQCYPRFPEHSDERPILFRFHHLRAGTHGQLQGLRSTSSGA